MMKTLLSAVLSLAPLNSRASSIPVMVSLIVLAANSMGNAQKLDAKIDIALVIPSSWSQPELDALKNTMHTLSQDHFEMGEQKVKLAILYTETGNIVLQDLTGEQTVFKNFLNQWTPTAKGGPHAYDTAFSTIREKMFNSSDEDRPKAVIVILPDFPGKRDGAAEEARLLREKGVPVSVIFNQDVLHDGGLHVFAEEVATGHRLGIPMRIINIPGQDFYANAIGAISKIKPFLLRDLCEWTTSCRYEIHRRDVCKAEVRRKSEPNSFDDNGAQCLTIKPDDPACTLDDCRAECDKRCYCNESRRPIGPW